MAENIQNCCRICLDVESEHVPILSDSSIHVHLRSCLGISVSANDLLPKSICVSCVSQLSDFYNFQLNARCSIDWLESALQEQTKKTSETKTPIQPLPDSEYNSDSLLEFLNNTANIEEYLNNLGKEDIPSIVNMLDRNQENSMDSVSRITNFTKTIKQPSPKKKEITGELKKKKMDMEIDVLDSEVDIVKEILMKEIEPKNKVEKHTDSCFACKAKCENIQKLTQHLSICDLALRTCVHCNLLFDSKIKMQQHSLIHNVPLTCNCGKQFQSKEKLNQHYKTCHIDYGATLGCIYRCKQCSMTFKERFQLYKHAKEHILKSEERICDFCGHKFNGTNDLKIHKKEVHKIAEDLIFRCKVCGKSSASHKEIYLHIQQNHLPTPEPESHLCDTCGKSFTARASLTRHILQHNRPRCKKNCTDVMTKDEHVNGQAETVICERCGQNVNRCNLQVHQCV